MDETLSPTSLAVMGAAMSLSLAAVIAAAVRALSGRPPIPYEPREPAPWTCWDVCWIWLYVALSLMSGVLGALAGEEEPTPTPESLLGMLAFLALLHTGIIGLSLLSARLRGRLTARDLGFDGRKLLGDARLGLAAFLVALGPVYLVQAVVWYGFDLQEPHLLLEMVAARPELFWPCALSAVVVAPITEELMFRLLLQGWLERVQVVRRRAAERVQVDVIGPESAAPVRCDVDAAAEGFAPAAGEPIDPRSSAWNPYVSPAHPSPAAPVQPGGSASDIRPGWLSLLLPAALFALVHGWPDCLPLFLFALVLGYVYRQTHRIVPCIVLHAALNGGSMLLLWLQLRG